MGTPMKKAKRMEATRGLLQISVLALGLAALLAFSRPAAALIIDTNTYPRCQPGPGFTCKDLFIESFDGTRLDSSLYVPDSATPAHPAPAILNPESFLGHRITLDVPFYQALAAHGYVVLAYTTRGYARSEGQTQFGSPDFEGKDGSAMITWLANPANTGGVVQLDAPGDPRV